MPLQDGPPLSCRSHFSSDLLKVSMKQVAIIYSLPPIRHYIVISVHMIFDERNILSRLIELVGDPFPIPFKVLVDVGDGVIAYKLPSFT